MTVFVVKWSGGQRVYLSPADASRCYDELRAEGVDAEIVAEALYT